MKSFSHVGECRPALRYAAVVVAMLLADTGWAEQFTAVNISAKPVASALTELAHETGVNVLFSPDAVRGLQSVPVNAKVSPEGAARLLLGGTSLDVLKDSSGALIVRARGGDAVSTLAVAAAAQTGSEPVAPPVPQTPAGDDQPSIKQQETQIPSSHREDGLPTAQAPVGLEEIIVTAQKREERLQDVPIAITALSRTQIEARGISNVVDLKSIAPNLLVSLMPNSNVVSQVSLRGGVTINGGLYWEPSTGLYMDGVYLGKAVGSVVDVVELERIEVLRGPQGTLYGRNTMAGAVNFVTRKPSGEFGGMTSVELGNYGGHIEKLSLDLPRWGSARLSLAARKEDRDGLVNLTNGGELDSRDKLGVRVALALDFTDSFVADYRFDYTKIDQAPPHNQLYHVTPNSELFTAAAAYASRKRLGAVSTNWPGYERLDLHGHAFTLTWDVNEGNQLKSISARRTLRNNDSVDLDGVPLTITTANRISDLEQRSQELQWVGRLERLDYVLGLYYYEDEGQTINPHVFFFGSDNSQYGFGVEARSAYGQLDWHVTDALTLTAGLRRTKEDKTTWRFKSATPAFLGPIPWVSAEASFAATTPLATIAYKVNSRLNIYAKSLVSGRFQSKFNWLQSRSDSGV